MHHATPRTLWRVVEPWFQVGGRDPSVDDLYERIGLVRPEHRYFGTRLGAMGPIGAREAVAVLYGFSPAFVATGVPSVWEAATPETIVQARVEAVPVSTFNPYALATAQTRVAVELVHGTEAGLITTLSLPTAQLKRPSGFENAQNVVEWPLELVPLPDSGNDQWSLELT